MTKSVLCQEKSVSRSPFRVNDFRKQNRDHLIIINLMAAFSLVFSWFSVSLVGDHAICLISIVFRSKNRRFQVLEGRF